MITKLSKQQELEIPKFIDKWIKVAVTPMNHNKSIEYTKKLYKLMKQEEPIIIIGLSPMNTALLCSLFFTLVKDREGFSQLRSQLYSQLDSQLSSQLDSQLRSQLDSQLHSQLSSQLRSQLDSQLHSQLSSQLRSQLRSQLDSQLHSQLDSQLHSQLDSQLYSQLGSQLSSQLRSQLRSQLYSQLDSQLSSQLDSQLYSQLDSQLSSQLGSQLSSQLYSQLEDINQNWCLGLWWLTWCAWYDYSKFIGVEFNEDNYDLFMNYNSEVTFIIPYKGIAFISEKPTEIHWKDKRLHNEKGLAVKYPDNYGLYCLNGVGVTKEIVEISAEELDANLVTKEKNAEVRREIVRKIGVERVCQKLNAKVLDKQDAYELLNLDLGENRIRPYLKMINPSIGTFHIEGVSPDCKTVEEALSWRNGTKEKPTILT